MDSSETLNVKLLVYFIFDDISGDEFFISEKAAKAGIVVKNTSTYEPLVLLQNYANNNPEVPAEK